MSVSSKNLIIIHLQGRPQHDSTRHRAEVTGKVVQFYSRNPKIATVRWHARFKAEYRTKADAIAAKQAWEEKGKIL